ncbi:MAG: hypothetical protein NT062_32680 [Proteobacteria bacterium]|nr:hypothetical protein [Pseudomonadota bacterium]
MRHGSLIVGALVLVASSALGGCPSGDGAIGDTCDGNGDCDGSLQCLGGTCIQRCQRAPECGDGYACDERGYCHLASGQQGDACTAEAACAPGLSCQINGDSVDDQGTLLASCTTQNAGHPASSTCAIDQDCRNGTCALGHCVDLCDATRDCGSGLACMTIPRVSDRYLGVFQGCLPSHGNLRWPLAIAGPSQRVLVPIPSAATSLSLVMSVDDPNQLVGVTRVVGPDDAVLLTSCGELSTQCDPTTELFASRIRHRPERAQSVMLMPTDPAVPLVTGAYDVTVSSLRLVDASKTVTGSAIPRVTAVLKLDRNVILDLHFHFLDLDDHPCAAALGGPTFRAELARGNATFQDEFVGELRTIFAHGGVAIGALTYDDIRNHPELDGLELEDSASLLALGDHDTGIDVFFVRTLSPVGIQALGPNPGPGLPGTRQSGIVVGIDSLCYRSWHDLARLTAHELARYMGLFHNVETDNRRDPIGDSDESSANLMFYSEFGGTDLSAGQSEILKRSSVLR